MRRIRGIRFFILFITAFFFFAGIYSYVNFQKKPVETLPNRYVPVQSTQADIISVEEKAGWTLKAVQFPLGGPLTAELYIINNKSLVYDMIGHIGVYNASHNAIFSSDATQVAFVNYGKGNRSYNLHQAIITVYSLIDGKIIKEVTLDEVARALPELDIPRNADLSFIAISPDNTRVAMSYGYILEPDYNSDIIIVNFAGSIATVAAKGLVQGWKDSRTLLYEMVDSAQSEGNYPKRVVKEITVVY